MSVMFKRAIFFCLIITGSIAFARADVVVRGRVKNQAGHPIEGARISAFSATMGTTLFSALQETLTTRSDAAGKFEVHLPYADVRYQLLGELAGHENFWQSFIATDGREVDGIMPEAGRWQRIEGRIFDADDKPVANLEVNLIGEIGCNAKTVTGDDGRFAFDRVPDYIGQAVLIAKRDGFVLPQFIVHQRPARDHLKLVKSATMRGTLLDATSAVAVAGATVTVRPEFMSGYSRTAKSDERGRWQINDLPPGDYILIAEGNDHYGTRAFDPSLGNAAIKLLAGDADIPLKLDRKAALSGVVVDREGRGVAGALVAMTFAHDPQHNERYRCVRTDAAGRFAIASAMFRGEASLQAFDSHWGFAGTTLNALRPGQHRDNIRLQLCGSARVSGIVVDATGKVLEHVKLETTWQPDVTCESGADGKFDFGRVALGGDAKAPLAIHARPPRPMGSHSILATDRMMLDESQVRARTFYQDAAVAFAPPGSPGERIELKIVLNPTDLLTFSGRVIDERGDAPLKASVHVFAGSADANWDAIAAPRFASSYDRGSTAVQLGETDCAEGGVYRVYAVRADGEAVGDGTRYCIGVVVNGDARKLVTGVLVPAGKLKIVTNIRLDPKPAGGVKAGSEQR